MKVPMTMQATQVFRLDSASLTLVVLVRDSGAPEIAYFGPAIAAGTEDAVPFLRARNAFHNALDLDVVQASLMPSLGTGNANPPAFRGSRNGTDWTADFTVSHIDQTAHGLALTMQDDVSGLTLASTFTLCNAVLEMQNTLTCWRGAFHVEDLAAGVMLIPEQCGEGLVHDGQWCNEFFERRIALDTGSWSAENRRGRTSHSRFPQIMLGTPAFGETNGLVYGFHLGWSGNHRVAVDVLDDGRRLVRLGEYLHPGEIILNTGETYTTPKLFATCAQGLAQMSRQFHAHVRGHILHWPQGQMRPRPVTLNTWEGNYFSHDIAALKAQADAAAALGIERFVLDDGWFGIRDDDTGGLGDWHIDTRKYPDGLKPLIDHVKAQGMEFGLWVEPEMVNENSDLYRAHPDWVLTTVGRPLVTGRNQLVLDMTRSEVLEHLFFWLDGLLRSHDIAYLKWDMNRDLVASSGVGGRPAYHAQVTALYTLLARLRAAHPQVEIETCSSGGGRADYGILPHTHRIWTSDCTDALERVRIQRGYSRFFPPELMGAHVSASPNHQTGRRHTLGWRAAVAFFGHFGLEIDPRGLSSEEFDALSGWITLHKRLRPLLHGGLHLGFDETDGRAAHGVVNHGQTHALIGVFQSHSQSHKGSAPLRISGLHPQARYRICLLQPEPLIKAMWSEGQKALLDGQIAVSGAMLAQIGIVLPTLAPESALILEIQQES